MLKIVTFPLFLLVALSMFLFVLSYPTEKSSDKMFNLLLWAIISASVTVIMLKFGKQFVDYPTLVELPPVRGSRIKKD